MKRLFLVLSVILLYVNLIGCSTISDTSNAYPTDENPVINSSAPVNSSTPAIVQSPTVNNSDSITSNSTTSNSTTSDSLTSEPSEIPASAPESQKTSEVSPTAEVETIVAASDDNTIKTEKNTEETVKKEVTVYITESGEKYHSSGCQYLRKSKIPISLDDAKARGFTPCSKCKPPV